MRIHKKKKPPKEKPTERAPKEKPAARATARAAPKGGGENVRLGTAGRLFMET